MFAKQELLLQLSQTFLSKAGVKPSPLGTPLASRPPGPSLVPLPLDPSGYKRALGLGEEPTLCQRKQQLEFVAPPKLAYYVPPSYLVELDGFTTETSLVKGVSKNFLAVRATLALVYKCPMLSSIQVHQWCLTSTSYWTSCHTRHQCTFSSPQNKH